MKMEYVPDIDVGKMIIVTSVGLYTPTEAEEFGSRGWVRCLISSNKNLMYVLASFASIIIRIPGISFLKYLQYEDRIRTYNNVYM